MHCKSCEQCIIYASKHRGGDGRGDYCHKACVKSLNMSQLGRQRSDQMEATHGGGRGEWDVGQASHANDVNQNLSVSPTEAVRSWTFQQLADHLALCSVGYLKESAHSSKALANLGLKGLLFRTCPLFFLRQATKCGSNNQSLRDSVTSVFFLHRLRWNATFFHPLTSVIGCFMHKAKDDPIVWNQIWFSWL